MYRMSPIILHNLVYYWQYFMAKPFIIMQPQCPFTDPYIECVGVNKRVILQISLGLRTSPSVYEPCWVGGVSFTHMVRKPCQGDQSHGCV